MFERLDELGFDLKFTFHADAILSNHFPGAVTELDEIISETHLPITEIISGGGGEAKVTQRLRHNLANHGWAKTNFNVEKRVNDNVTYATSHEVDHVKRFENGNIALEIEWNNKDPFFDRDLENFHRLHADGAISLGIIVTRGRSLQDSLEGLITQYAIEHGIENAEDMRRLGIVRTQRQSDTLARRAARSNRPFPEVWAALFKADKFGSATTHWAKLEDRLNRGVGNPCPFVAIGLPASIVDMGLPE